MRAGCRAGDDLAGSFRDRYLELAPDLIGFDLAMPGGDGIELIRFLAAEGCRAPILIITGHDRRVLDAAARLGRERGLNIVETLSKPFSVETLKGALERMVGALIAQHRSAIVSTLAEDLAVALRTNELRLVYQPKVSLTTSRWTGVEALLRWQHPTRGLVPPTEFIPIAEANGLMRPLTERVIGMALDRWREWFEAGYEIGIAINLSAKDIQPDFPDRFELACAEKSVAPTMITFELTETATHDLTDLLDIATRLRLKGPRLSIDDFGTGYSSVVQLHRLPFSELKVDRVFVSELSISADARTIVRAIVDLAHALDLTVVAEGPEQPGRSRVPDRDRLRSGAGLLFLPPGRSGRPAFGVADPQPFPRRSAEARNRPESSLEA